MVYHYRETDAVSARWTGNTSGVKLSAAQADENTWNSESAIAALQAALTSTRSISSITISGDELTFHMSDSTLEGPFTLPIATLLPRGAWAPSTSYAFADTFYINGTVYFVLLAHTSALTFDAGANDGSGHNFYVEFVPNPGNALATGGAVGQVYTKTSSTDFAANWQFVNAIHVTFSPSTASGLISTNVNDAIEEVEAKIATEIAAIVVTALEVTFTPSTASTLISTNVSAALDELAAKIISETDSFAGLTGTIGASQRDGTLTALGTTGTVSLDPSLGDVFEITPTGNVTLNAASAPANAKITLIVTTSGTSSFNITPNTNFKSQGVLATGTVTAKTFSISFVGDGTNLVETGRTIAM